MDNGWGLEDTILGAALGAWLSVVQILWTTWAGVGVLLYCLALSLGLRFTRNRDIPIGYRELIAIILVLISGIAVYGLHQWAGIGGPSLAAFMVILGGWPAAMLGRQLERWYMRHVGHQTAAEKEGAA